MASPSVKHKWWLAKTSNLGKILDLTSRMHNKNLQLMLNQGGTGTGYLHLEDSKSALIEEHKTSLLCYRNNEAIWSGEIFNCIENTESLQLQITAKGWFELLNKREIHTGYEWYEMAIKASGREIVRYPVVEHETELAKIEAQYNEVVAEGFYTPVATESAQQLFYANTPMAEIANDLIIRANIDVPTLITIGEVAPTNSINLTLQQFQNVGEEITKLTAIESGFDFNIDPLTRKFNTYRNEIKGGIAGLGVDRGPGVRFTHPGNCDVTRTATGTKTQNRTEAVGEYSVGKSESIQSIQENGLFEGIVSAPEVINLNILNALATVETLTLEKPFTVITFTPRSVNKEGGVPRPYEQYEIGDIVYAVVKRGPRLQIGLKTPQPVRVFGFTLAIEDSGVEKISNIQTTYSQ